MLKCDVKSYVYRDGQFVITIYEYPDHLFDAWLFHESLGTCKNMFGFCSDSLDDFLPHVERNLLEYESDYIAEFREDLIYE